MWLIDGWPLDNTTVVLGGSVDDPCKLHKHPLILPGEFVDMRPTDYELILHVSPLNCLWIGHVRKPIDSQGLTQIIHGSQ